MVPVIGEIKEYSSNLETFNFFSANEVKYGTDGTLPALNYKDVIGIVCQFNAIIDHNIFIRNTLLQPHGKDVEMICTQFKAWAEQFDQ